MEDVQSGPAQVPLTIDNVGVRHLRMPLLVPDGAGGRQQTVASVEMGVELPSSLNGTHMSRFVEVLEQWDGEISCGSVARLLETLRARLGARRASADFRFPYFVRKAAPSSGMNGIISYDCRLTGEQDGDSAPRFLLEVDVPVMTVCPCSKAISDEGAHSQRALVRMAVRMDGLPWIGELIEIAEQSGSSPVHTLLKREDEKYVTEHAFACPTFVEDVVRNAAFRLEKHAHIRWFKVDVESQESIHNHDAFACIERTLR